MEARHMRKVMLTVLALVGLFLLCGSDEKVVAQNDTTTPPKPMGWESPDTRLQGAEGTEEATSDTSATSGATTFGTPSGVGGSGTSGTSDTQAPGMAGGTGAATPEAGQTTGGASTGLVELPQSVLQLQQEVAQVKQDVAQLRAQLESLNANMGVGGSGQAGVAPSGAQAGTSDTQAPAPGVTDQRAVAGSTPPGTPPRAGTAQETGARGTPPPSYAVVNAIYTGTVRSVSNGRLELLDDEGKPFTVELGDRTRVLRNGQRISAQELKQGTRVRATVDMLSGRNQATEVTTLPAR
jgi:hypothetical protein